jgi:hypothetical protein
MCPYFKINEHMNAKLLFLLITSLILAGCKKEKAETKPSIKILKVDRKDVISGGVTGVLLDIDLEILDKEGDVRDSVFILKRDDTRIGCSGNNKTLFYNIPVYPDEQKQKITFRLKFATLQLSDYVELAGSACPRKDTSVFKVWVKDKGGNRSDTVTTERIAL